MTQPAPASCCRCSTASPPGSTHDPVTPSYRELQQLGAIAIVVAAGVWMQQSLPQWPLVAVGVLGGAYLWSAWPVLIQAGRNLLRGRMFDETFLMTIATLGALVLGEYPEAVAVMVFYRAGEWVQEQAVGQSRRSIAAVLAVRPDRAMVWRDEAWQVVHPEQVQVGDRLQVNPGEKIPLDGVVLTGISEINTAALTGESMPRPVEPGDPALAGTLNQTGQLTLRVTKPFGESSVSKILDLVENASRSKAKTAKFITQFAQIYTPIVVLGAIALALIPPLIIPGATVQAWGYRALILLVVSCPCGLVISIPLGYFGGIGGAAKRGILIKGATFLDTLTQVKTVIFDKTGTLTQGEFQVTEIHSTNGRSDGELLAIAAHAEAHSSHPIAASIRAAYGQPLDLDRVTDYREEAGYGVKTQVQDAMVWAGSDRLFPDLALPPTTGTVVHLSVDHHYAGHITLADTPKPDAALALQRLAQLGITHTVMLTGDQPSTAAAIAAQLGVSDYRAGLLPEDKVTAVAEIQRERPGAIAFVGDGINDAPALARADVGLAMGALGSDAAIETADVVLMQDTPLQVVEAIALAHRTRRIVWQNIALALGIKGFMILLSAWGVATLWEAVFADVGVALLAIVNATRIAR
ncbi:heavy metal translocating P-type ATPase [Spirulina major]|uniref:heavy metal translocating P-type ATPase n=1 Tax=Spirulina major TaxID=270636 RepID=UPI000932D2D7|nr:heavy metal translocating P-type ATPase [Spirulina major]